MKQHLNKLYAKFLYAWYHYPILFIIFLPLTVIYRSLIALRLWAFQHHWLKSYQAPCPVIIVGNLVVGGTGKTPVVIALANLLKSAGYQPGIITRGYGSVHQSENIWVTRDSDVRLVGDEPVLIADKTDCIVVKNKNRAMAAKAISAQCDIIISDDGLQHYALARNIEIVMMPQKQWLKNPFCLPAGPWRESKSRLAHADFVMGYDEDLAYTLQPRITSIVSLKTGEVIDCDKLRGKTVHAVCAIAMPWRFFVLINQYDIKTIEHIYPDHAVLSQDALQFTDDLPVLITEKDAVKCKDLNLDNVWVVHIQICFDEKFKTDFLNKLKSLRG